MSLKSKLTGLVGDRKAAAGPRPRGKLRQEDQRQLASRLDVVNPQDRGQTLDILDALRQTRGQRQIEPVQIPVHLRGAMPLDDNGVEVRATRAGGDD